MTILRGETKSHRRGRSLGLEVVDLCLVLDVVIPYKFKVPNFDKKMTSCAHDDKLLIHFFQESLMGGNFELVLELEAKTSVNMEGPSRVRPFKNNINIIKTWHLTAPNYKTCKTFKEYVQQWREVAAQVQPPLSKKEIFTMFIHTLQSPFYDRVIGNVSSNFYTLQSPFYDRVIGNVSSNFSNLVLVGKRIEMGLRYDSQIRDHEETSAKPKQEKGRRGKRYCIFIRGTEHQTSPWYTKLLTSVLAKSTNDVRCLSISSTPTSMTLSTTTQTTYQPPYHQTYQPRPNYQLSLLQTTPQLNTNNPQRRNNDIPRTITPILMTYIEFLPHLIRNSLMVTVPLKPLQPHIQKTMTLMLDVNIIFKENGPNVGDNPLLGHGSPSVNAIKDEPSH
ncbi:hypothetical protein CR513_26948, partial [Mucuna pruriens]